MARISAGILVALGTAAFMSELTELFHAVGRGDQAAMNRLLELMYADLHQLAQSRLRKSSRELELDTTELVHESYLRFLDAGRLSVTDRGHFLAYSARVMRSIIVDLVRKQSAEKHGGSALHVTLNTNVGSELQASDAEIIRVNDALEVLAQTDDRLVKVVELLYFAGMTHDEAATALGVTGRTVRRDWRKARLLLSAALD
jgi:RNA polymerase sigma factor (TIGR02999 family)